MTYGRMTRVDVVGNGSDAVDVQASSDHPGTFLVYLHGVEEGWEVRLDTGQLRHLLDEAVRVLYPDVADDALVHLP